MTSTRLSRKERTHSQFARVYRWELGSSKILTLFYTLAVLVLMPGFVLMSILQNRSYYTNMLNWEGQTVESVQGYFANTIMSDFGIALGSGMALLIFTYTMCFAGKSFSYMHARRSVDLFHAVPVRRRPLLLGKYAAILTCMEVPLGIAALLCHLLCQINGIPVEPLFFLSSLGQLGLMAAACATFAMLFMVISGTLTGAYLSMLYVSVMYPFFMGVVDTTMEQFLPGYVSVLPPMLYTLFCPVGAMYQCLGGSLFGWLFGMEAKYDTLVSSEGGIPWFYIWWIAMTVVMLLTSVYYYNRRKSESAENYFSFPVIRGLIRALVSVAVGLECGLIVGQVLDSNAAYLLTIVVSAAVVHTFYQFILTQSFQGFWKTVPAFAVSMILTGGFLFSLYTGGLGYVTRVPDAGTVSYTEFTLPTLESDGSKEAFLSQYTGLDLYGAKGWYLTELSPKFDTEEDIGTLSQLHNAILEARFTGPYLPFGKKQANAYSLYVSYTLKNGKQIRRSYSFPVFREDDELISALAAVQKLDTLQAYVLYNNASAEDINSFSVNKYQTDGYYEAEVTEARITAEEQRQLWDTLAEELNSAEFSYPVDLPSYEDWLMYLESGAGDGSDAWSDFNDAIAKEDKYTEELTECYSLYFNRVPYERISGKAKEIIQKHYDPESVSSEDYEGQEIPSLPSYVNGYTFNIPECCPKTRQLIDELTSDYGVWYSYENDEEVYED